MILEQRLFLLQKPFAKLVIFTNIIAKHQEPPDFGERGVGKPDREMSTLAVIVRPE